MLGRIDTLGRINTQCLHMVDHMENGATSSTINAALKMMCTGLIIILQRRSMGRTSHYVSYKYTLACPAPMCTPTKPSLGGADSLDGGEGDDDGVIIFAGGIDFQGMSLRIST